MAVKVDTLTRKIDSQTDIKNLICQAVSNLGWTYKDQFLVENNKDIREIYFQLKGSIAHHATTNMNMKTGRDKFFIIIQDEVFHLISMNVPLIDWGRNKDNINSFKNEFSKLQDKYIDDKKEKERKIEKEDREERLKQEDEQREKRKKEKEADDKKKEKEKKEKKKLLTKKYGDDIASRIVEGNEPWFDIDMTKDMVIDMWGKPELEKKNVTKELVRLKWYYGSIATRQNTVNYNHEIIIENDMVVSWGNDGDYR